jgi:S1-C subfamily serine protease
MKTMRYALSVLMLLAGAVLTLPAAARAELTDIEMTAVRDFEQQRVKTIEKVYPTVVAIYGENVQAGGGSGVLIDPEGLAVTNYHVVAAAGKEGWAGLADGKLYRWKLVGIDPGGDLAVILLDREKAGIDAFPYARLGDSNEVQVGDFVMAMGNPFALAENHAPTVTLGIVSGTHRYQGGQDPGNTLLVYGNCIQIDSSINPGNSGGPLFNMEGEVVGINGRGSFEERGRVNVGLGYAISAEQVKYFLPDLLATKVAQHATLDATFRNAGDGEVICDGIDYGRCPLTEHGLELGDVLVSFNGHEIHSANEYLNELSMLPAGWPVEVVWRRGQIEARATVELNPLKYAQQQQRRPQPRIRPVPDGEQPENQPKIEQVQVEAPTEPGEIQDAELNQRIAKLLLARAGAVTDDEAAADDLPQWQRQPLDAYKQVQIVGPARLPHTVGCEIKLTDDNDQADRLWLAILDDEGSWATTPQVVRWKHGGEASEARLAAAPPRTQWDGNFFLNALNEAQSRLVKIYGAGIGREHGYATGVLVSGEGHIVTAQGVWLAGATIRVVLPDGSLHYATVERRSDPIQLALLKVDADTPHYYKVDREPVGHTGDWVLAVSNAYNVASGTEPLSANLGIIAMRGELDTKKRAQDFDVFGDVLMVDAIVANPGAPGGALVTQSGELVGVVGKILEAQTTNTRLNYAVPNDLVARFIAGESLGDLVIAQGDPEATDGPGELGIRIFKLTGRRAPAYVDRVIDGSPAAEAGVKKDDLILTFNGEWVRNVRDYESITEDLKAGQMITLTIKRGLDVLSVQLTAAPVEQD